MHCDRNSGLRAPGGRIKSACSCVRLARAEQSNRDDGRRSRRETAVRWIIGAPGRGPVCHVKYWLLREQVGTQSGTSCTRTDRSRNGRLVDRAVAGAAQRWHSMHTSPTVRRSSATLLTQSRSPPSGQRSGTRSGRAQDSAPGCRRRAVRGRRPSVHRWAAGRTAPRTALSKHPPP